MSTWKIMIIGLICIISGVAIMNRDITFQSKDSGTQIKTAAYQIDRDNYGILVYKYKDHSNNVFKYLIKGKEHYYYLETNIDKYRLLFEEFREYNEVPFQEDLVVRQENAYVDTKAMIYHTDEELCNLFTLVKIDHK